MKGCLYLCPVPIGDGLPQDQLAHCVLETIKPIRHFIVENERSARRFLSRVIDQTVLDGLSLPELSEHSSDDQIPGLLAPLLAGHDCALISEAGSPCIADPGAPLVLYAHRVGIRVCPLPGPVSMMLALMASGMNGQRFSFLGYLPVDDQARRRSLSQMEQDSASRGTTYLFIETPYRNDTLIHTILSCLRPDSRLCVAANLTGQDETVVSQSLDQWRNCTWRPGKVPTVFVLSAHQTAGNKPPSGGRQGAKDHRRPSHRTGLGRTKPL